VRRVSLPLLLSALALLLALAALASRHDDAPPRTASPSRGVAAYPGPGTPTASPRTQISFRGASAAELGTPRVRGSLSGPHAGRLVPHPDGRGASFLPARPFRAGETVTVTLARPIVGARGDRYSFRIGDLLPTTIGLGHGRGSAKAPPLRSAPSLAPPAVTVAKAEPGSRDAILIGPKLGAGQSGPMILDGRGRVRWFRPLPAGERVADVQVQRYRGRPVLTWWQGRTGGGFGQGEGVIADRRYRTIATVRAGNGYRADMHELRLTGRGTALILIYQPVRWDLGPVGGPRDGIAVDAVVQEVDVRSGLVLLEWHSLGHVPLRESQRRPPRSAHGRYDYLHANSVDVGPRGDLLISARLTSTVYDVDRRSGAIVWRLGGKDGDFALGPGASFHDQHDARWVRRGRTLTLFDNSARGVRPASRAIELRLDLARRRATLVRALRHGDLLAATQGSATLERGGAMFVGWGSQGVFSDVAADGTLRFDARLPRGYDSYRAYRQPWQGRPTTRPSVAATRSGSRLRVYTSWNGDSAVTRWRVLAGPSARRLRPVGRPHAWTGLETALTIAARDRAVVAVAALSASGRTLARSRPERVRAGIQPAR